MGKLPVVLAGCPKQFVERRKRHLPELSDRANLQSLKDSAGHLSDTPQFSDRQRVEKRLYFIRLNNNEAIRLLQGTGDLGNKFVSGHADGGGQLQFRPDSLFDLPTDFGGASKQGFAPRDIEKGFVERKRFNQWSELLKNVSNLPGHGRVVINPRLNDDSMRAKSSGTTRRHGTMHSKLASLIIRRSHNPTTFRRTTNDHRLTNKRRILPLLNRGIESIHVDMQDHAEYIESRNVLM